MIEHNLVILQDCDINKYDICISCSLFQMKSPYRTFGKYIFKFKYWFSKIPKNAFVRMYIDASLSNNDDFMKILDKKYDNLQIIIYEFPDFLDKDKLRHDGTFGSITRFLAFYDKDLLNKVKYIWTSDVDIKPFWFNYQYIRDLDIYKCNSSYFTSFSYDRSWTPYNTEFPMMANHIIIRSELAKKLDSKYFYSYLEDILNDKYLDVFETIVLSGNRKIIEIPRYFIYGFDELFLNLYINPFLNKNNALVYIYINIFKPITKYIKDLPYLQDLRKYEDDVWEARNEISKKYFDYISKLNDKLYEIAKELKIYDNESINIILNNYKKYPRKYYSHFKFGAITKI